MRAHWNSRYRPIACHVLSFRELRFVVDYLEGSLSVATWDDTAWIGGTASGTIYRSVRPTAQWQSMLYCFICSYWPTVQRGLIRAYNVRTLSILPSNIYKKLRYHRDGALRASWQYGMKWLRETIVDREHLCIRVVHLAGRPSVCVCVCYEQCSMSNITCKWSANVHVGLSIYIGKPLIESQLYLYHCDGRATPVQHATSRHYWRLLRQ